MGLIWQVLILLLAVGVVLEALILIAVMRQVGGILIQLRPARVGEIEGEGPPVGQALEFEGLDVSRPAIVLFLSPDCQICKPLLPAIPALQRNYRELGVVTVVTGQDEARRGAYAEQIGESARTDLPELMKDWLIPGTPYAVGLDAGGVVNKSGVVNSLDQLESLAGILLSGENNGSVASRQGEEEVLSRNGHEEREEEESGEVLWR
jgi:thiol-disulfide isomerase/thioredoxin